MGDDADFLAVGFLIKSPRTSPRTVFGAVCNVTSDSLARETEGAEP